MSTDFKLGLDIVPGKLFQGMDERSSSICRFLESDLGFPTFVRATPDSTAWSSANGGVAATVRYAEDNFVKAFEDLTGIAGRLFIGLRPDKQDPAKVAINNMLGVVKGILARTDCDAAFTIEWDHVILRRMHEATTVYYLSPALWRRDSDELIRQLDPSYQTM